ncbi:MAG: DUF6493 family protein, partial [Bacteroidota bacterium]
MSQLSGQLKTWINQGDPLAFQRFLQDLSPRERKSLADEIQSMEGSYLREGLLRLQSPIAYKNLLGMAAFACLNTLQFRASSLGWDNFVFAYESGLFEWCRPKWLAEFLDGCIIGFQAGPNLSYDWMLNLQAEGIWQPSPEQIAQALVMAIALQQEQGWSRVYQFYPASLSQNPETLSKHIWYCFEYACGFAEMDRIALQEVPEYADQSVWRFTFGRLIAEGALDRSRLLAASLNACLIENDLANRKWYAELFAYLEPTVPELLSLHAEMMAVFQVKESAVVRIILRYLKKIAGHPRFVVEDYIAYADGLFVRSQKGLLRDAIILTHTLAQKNARFHPQLCQLVIPALLHEAEDIQVRTAKLIRAFGEAADSHLQASLQTLLPHLRHETRKILAEFLPGDEAITDTGKRPLPSILTEENRIHHPQTLQDWLLEGGKMLKGELVASEILLDGAKRFWGEIGIGDLALFEPLTQRVLQKRESLRGVVLIHGHFWLSYVLNLCARYPEASLRLQELFSQHLKRFQLDKRQYTLEAWESVDQLDELPILTVFVQRANRILQSLHELADLPLLASPTHRPHWIDPQVLFSRAQAYEEAGIQLPVVELQIALCR